MDFKLTHQPGIVQKHLHQSNICCRIVPIKGKQRAEMEAKAKTT